MNTHLRRVILLGVHMLGILAICHQAVAETAQPKEVSSEVSKNNQLDLTDTQDTTATVDPNSGPYVKISSVLFEPPSGWSFKEFENSSGYVDIIPGSIDGYTATTDPESSSAIRIHWLADTEPTSIDEFGLRAEGNMSPPSGNGFGGSAVKFA